MKKFVAVLILMLTLLAHASNANASGPKSQSVIDFDDETIEGLNKRPLDSLSQISDRNKRRNKPHLYRKRSSFKSETGETIRVVRFTQ